VVAKGSDTVQQQIAAQGLKGPVKATVVRARDGVYTVKFKADDGKTYTVQAESAMATPPKAGETVSIFYQADDPTVVLISDAPVGALTGIAGTLRTAGIVALVVGGVLLIAAILGFVLGKKSPPAVMAPQYPAQGGYPVAPQNYPAQPQPYQPQPYQPQQQNYPAQNYPAQNYPAQNQPTQNYPAQNYPAQNYPAQNQPTQNYPPPPPRDAV
jgi:hypothetical protein